VTQAKLAASSVATSGPEGSFGAILFIEKEGFAPLFGQVRLDKRFDIGILSVNRRPKLTGGQNCTPNNKNGGGVASRPPV
jgi:hypothetical protein